jgi:hypothetical protein
LSENGRFRHRLCDSALPQLESPPVGVFIQSCVFYHKPIRYLGVGLKGASVSMIC